MSKQMSLDDFVASVAIPMFGFAIVNPMGPSFMGFAIGRTNTGNANLMYFSINPFSQTAEEVSKYQFDPKTVNTERMLGDYLIAEDIKSYLIGKKNDEQEFGTPTILFGVLDGESEEAINEQRQITYDIIRYSSNPNQTLDNLKQFPMNVMDRVSHEMNSMDLSAPTSTKRTSEVEENAIIEIAGHICNPEHIKQEIRGFNIAWTGAINFQKEHGNTSLVDNSLELENALKVIGNLYPSLLRLMVAK